MAQQKDGVNQHKAMAMGRGVTGMKGGGSVKHDDVAADRKMVKSMVKPGALTGMKGGGKAKSRKC